MGAENLSPLGTAPPPHMSNLHSDIINNMNILAISIGEKNSKVKLFLCMLPISLVFLDN